MTDLRTLLVEARSLGFLGGQAIERQFAHAKGFVDVCIAALGAELGSTPLGPGAERMAKPGEPPEPTRRILDLGAGGGVPGLILATSPWPFNVRTLLLDGSVRRAEWLSYAVDELGLNATVDVLGERAEVAGRDATLRHSQSVVVARSFGRPAVTAECASPFLSIGGILVVSEPPPPLSEVPLGDTMSGAPPVSRSGAAAVSPSSSELEIRWPPDKIVDLGFAPAVEWRARGFRYAVLRVEHLCPERCPRRTGIPTKRPLF